jgi:hypothetical protein
MRSWDRTLAYLVGGKTEVYENEYIQNWIEETTKGEAAGRAGTDVLQQLNLNGLWRVWVVFSGIMISLLILLLSAKCSWK